MAATAHRTASTNPIHIEIDIAQRTIRPVGDVDIATAPLLLAAAKSFAAQAPGDLTIDLRAVTFADSALLNVLADLRIDLNGRGATLLPVNETAQVLRLYLAGGFRGYPSRG